MPRPTKYRRIFYSPDFFFFKPGGIPENNLERVTLALDEFEAVRLADLEGLYQEDSANQMNISRQTFGNIITSAHKKIADCIINGKILKLEGGTINTPEEKNFTCNKCNYEWSVKFETGRPEKCPSCRCKNICRSETGKELTGTIGRKRGFGHRCCSKNFTNNNQS
jgi:predicted DNA-binding protein (UPF0251 family)